MNIKLDENYCLIVVPLRLQSTRLKEKILQPIAGHSLASQVLGRIKKVFDGRSDVRLIAAVDDERTVKSLKADFKNDLEIILTDPALPSGTDRVFAGFLEFEKRNPKLKRPRGIVNVQGDMPFLDGHALNALVDYYLKLNSDQLARTALTTLSQDWPADCDFKNIGQVKVISDRSRHAIYFSRFQIPYSRIPHRQAQKEIEFSSYPPELHIGVYGYTPQALAEFCSHGPIALEKFEGLEQLRALWLEKKMLVVKCDVAASDSFRGIDTPEDFKWAKAFAVKGGAKTKPTVKARLRSTKSKPRSKSKK